MSKLLSIITITFNDLRGVDYTIQSINYSIEGIEHIIVDGKSTDGTKEYLESLPNTIKWVSEPDRGLYDAMNKGQEMAKGEYILFMNSGDGFYSPSVLPKILELLKNQKPDVLYGETMYRNDKNEALGIRSEITTRKLPNELHWKKLIDGMLVCHQSFIVKRELSGVYILDNLSADVDWMISCLKKSTNALNANEIIANYLVGGLSNQKQGESLADRFKVFKKHYGLMRTIKAHMYMIVRHMVHKISA